MKAIAIALLAFAAFNAGLLLTMLYWFVFANEAPPFIQGSPAMDVVPMLFMAVIGAGPIGALLWSEPLA